MLAPPCDRLKQVRPPPQSSLVIGAEHDYTPHSEKEAYVADMPNATLELVEGSRHGTPFDRTEYFNARVLEFMSAP